MKKLKEKQAGFQREHFEVDQSPLFSFLIQESRLPLFLILLFSRVIRDSTPRYVGRSVSWSVGRSPFYSFGVFELFEHTAPAQMH